MKHPSDASCQQDDGKRSRAYDVRVFPGPWNGRETVLSKRNQTQHAREQTNREEFAALETAREQDELD